MYYCVYVHMCVQKETKSLSDRAVVHNMTYVFISSTYLCLGNI
jgi:hypothetical protein